MRDGPNFPPALAIAPSAPHDGAEPWRTDSAEDIAEEAAYLLLGYIAHSPPQSFSPRCTLYDQHATVIELGAGVGTAGLAVAQQLEEGVVVLTDLEHVLPLLERNAAPLARSRRAAVRALPWGDARAAARIQAEFGRVTHVLCSDLVYFPELLAPLLRSLIDLTCDGVPEVIIGYKVRSLVKEQPFWLAFGTWFDFEPVDVRHGADWIPFGSRAHHVRAGAHDAPAEDDYFVFVAHRRRDTLADAPPQSDADLLGGRRVRSGALIEAGAGADAFELLLLGRSV